MNTQPNVSTRNTLDLELTLKQLESSEALVLRLRTGLVDGHRHSLREISTFLGTTRSEARSLEWSGWQKLEQIARQDQDSLIALKYLLNRARQVKMMPQPLN